MPEVLGPTAPSLDSDKLDSLGNPKHDAQIPGSGKGATAPADSFSPDELAAKQKTAEAKLATSSTDAIDSRGLKKGAFQVTPQGYDGNGARLPDKVDYTKPVDPMVVHGPRGVGAPKDSFQG